MDGFLRENKILIDVSFLDKHQKKKRLSHHPRNKDYILFFSVLYIGY